MSTQDLLAAIAERIDRERIVADASAICDIHSPTGEEREVARWLAARMQRSGMQVVFQEVEDERFNVVGILPGTGGGRSLMFNGHMDTSYPFMPGVAGIAPLLDAPRPARLDGRWLYATGIENMKGAFASYLAAVDAVVAAGLRPHGDILITGVVGEVETAPVAAFTGRRYRGHGYGARHLVTHGGLADYCILGEPTNLRIGLASSGAIWARLTTRGPVGGSYNANWEDNAIVRLCDVLKSIESWAEAYRQSHATDDLAPRVTVVGVDGGWPWRAARSPGQASLYLDVRTTPEQSQIVAIHELQSALRSVETPHGRVECEIELYASVPGQRVEPTSPLVATIERAHAAVRGEGTTYRSTPATNDVTHYVRYGMPTVTYGPGGARRPVEEGLPDNEYVLVDNLTVCAQVYALCALDVCNRDV